jgi:hypothetical protein
MSTAILRENAERKYRRKRERIIPTRADRRTMRERGRVGGGGELCRSGDAYSIAYPPKKWTPFSPLIQ